MPLQNCSTGNNPAEDVSVLSSRLQQLRRLKSKTAPGQVSCHLQSALEVAKRDPADKTPEVSYIFIGIVVPSSQ